MPIWHDRLKQYERDGFREVAGPESNPRILKWAHGAGQSKWVKDDATPWCGIAMAGIMDECGLGRVVPREPARAISWKNLGVPCEAKIGAIVVFPREGGNHVTCIDHIAGDTWYCVGGNQSDAICTRPFRARDAIAVRWPIEERTTSEMTSESRIARAAARQQSDTAKTGATGSPPAVAPEPPPVPSGWRTMIEGATDNLGVFKHTADMAIDFTSFAAGQWRIILGGLALFFLLRILYDGHMIRAWRTQDHNEGRSQ